VKKLFLENVGFKIASVLLSIFLWVFVTSRGLSEMSLDIPLEFKNAPAGLELVSQSAKVVSLNIKGQERLVKDIRSSDIRVYIDLNKAKKGEGVYYLNKDNIKQPHMVNVINITPSYVKVLLDETITKTVPVRPVVIGTPESGFYVKSIDVIPKTVVIEGVRSELKKMYNLKTEPIDITGVNETFSHNVKLDMTGVNMRTKSDEVKIKIIIAGGRK